MIFRKRILWGLVAAVAAVTAVCYVTLPQPPHPVFPNGKRFAFSIVDDTDLTTLDGVRPVYDALARHGLRTTKTVWMVPSDESERAANRGVSLADDEYRAFVKDLAHQGFEIALHGVRGGSSTRPQIEHGLETFKREIGYYPRMQVNHSYNRDNLYWGRFRFSLLPFRAAAALGITAVSEGHLPESPYFWGDLARLHIQYVRQFTFQEINLLNVNPSLPFTRADTPFVNYWFQTSNGANRDAFVHLLSRQHLDQLEREGGVCLVYAHLGAGSFAANGVLDARVEERLKDLSSRPGWFAPASDILDFLRTQPAWSGRIGVSETIRLEAGFLASRILYGVP